MFVSLQILKQVQQRKDYGAGFCGNTIASSNGRNTTIEVITSAQSAALADFLAPIRCQAATRRKVSTRAITKSTRAMIKPAIRVINTACCSTKNPDGTKIWRIKAVTASATATITTSRAKGMKPIRIPRHVLSSEEYDCACIDPWELDGKEDIFSSFVIASGCPVIGSKSCRIKSDNAIDVHFSLCVERLSVVSPWHRPCLYIGVRSRTGGGSERIHIRGRNEFISCTVNKEYRSRRDLGYIINRAISIIICPVERLNR